MSATKRKGTVLVLHGWAQNAFVMHSRTKKLEKKLRRAGYDCLYLEAPHRLPMTSTVVVEGREVRISNGDRENARAWFTYSSSDSADASMALAEMPTEYIGLETSIDQVKACLAKCHNEDHVCAILGFSQGATFGHILSTLVSAVRRNSDPGNPLAKIRCAILLSGFPSMHENVSLANRTPSNGDGTARHENLDVESLHVFGAKDTSVPPSYGETLARCFRNPDVYDHGKGHVIPQNAAFCDRVIAFLDSCCA